MTEELGPKDHAEAVALFRAQVLGPLLCRDGLDRGELAAELRALSAESWRPPDSPIRRSYAVSTLERWYYRYRSGGLDALKPERRSDRGSAQALTEAQKQLLLDVRREHPRVSAALILRTLVVDGRLPEDLITEATLRRLYREHGLDRRTLAFTDREPRKRWEAARPGGLWHADVCHGPALRIDGKSVPLRVHAILDDKSRFVVAIEACTTEREGEMLRLLVKALRLHGAPEVLYLDNGPTYSGQALATACGRLGIALVHAKPHDPQARGKMERFWRTLREQCLDHLGGLGSLHDVQARLLAWLAKHYHATAHSALMGKCPAEVYEAEPAEPVSESMLREALTVHGRRRVRRDGTVSVGGHHFELDQGYLAGRVVTIGRSLLDPTEAPWVEHEQQRFALHPVDPVANARREKTHRKKAGIDALPFDPPGALLGQLRGGAR
ncbi:MAG: DDE-type integrase/transposase/recombinase [Nitriliruptoraceae bacterium]